MKITELELNELSDLLLEMSARLQRASSTMKRYAYDELRRDVEKFGFPIMSEDILQTIARADLAPELCEKSRYWSKKLKEVE
jgi:hypothetical protein